ncbi:hypothetical protein [Neorhizobium petrolearium]|uniref:hypothetical protein n=1 Tax=Neorhizobium petrolearium TaxID=515361 RepID=UPI003F18423F
MISEIFAWLFALFVIDPLHNEIRQRVEAANLPLQTLQQSQRCIAVHGPQLLKRAGENPGWATAMVLGIATGWTSPGQLFDARDPDCSALAGLLHTAGREDAEG